MSGGRPGGNAKLFHAGLVSCQGFSDRDGRREECPPDARRQEAKPGQLGLDAEGPGEKRGGERDVAQVDGASLDRAAGQAGKGHSLEAPVRDVQDLAVGRCGRRDDALQVPAVSEAEFYPAPGAGEDPLRLLKAHGPCAAGTLEIDLPAPAIRSCFHSDCSTPSRAGFRPCTAGMASVAGPRRRDCRSGSRTSRGASGSCRTGGTG